MRKYFLIIIFANAVFVSALSQNVDSLKKVLPSLHDSARVDCLNELSRNYLGLNIDTAAYYATLAYNESVKSNYIHGIAESLLNKANIEDQYDDASAEEKLCHEAIACYRKTANKKGLAETYWHLGLCLYAQSFFEETYIC